MTSVPSTVVDLVTPPSSPDLHPSGEEEEAMPPIKSEKRAAVNPPNYESDDGEVLQVQHPKKPRVDAADGSSAADDECVITGTTGKNPLIDFAHARWNCCKHPIAVGKEQTYCQNCHCVICDVPASECELWGQHCTANPHDSEVQRQRAFKKKNGAMPAVKCLLSQLKQVYPTEVNVELKSIVLKNYQRQVVSWMLDCERDGHRIGELIKPSESWKDMAVRVHGGFLSIEMGMGKTACTIAACKQNPMPTLVVAPALTCVQWSHQFSQYAPELSNAMLYCTSQRREEEQLLGTDVVVVNSTSNLLESVMKRVQRVVVDESHEVLAKSSGTAVKFLHNLSDYPNVKITWLVSGTPFGSSERIDDPAFNRQMRVLLQSKFQGGWDIQTSATTADVQKIVMRMEKKQYITDASGAKVSVMPIADIEIRTLQVGLSPSERELYNIAACMDGWTETRFKTENKRYADEISKELDHRFMLRKLVLGERIAEFRELANKRLQERFFAPDSEAPDLFYAKVDRLTFRIEECCKKLLNSSSKIDAVLEEIQSLKQRDPNFKAVIITESDGAGEYIKKQVGDKVGIMQRSKGRTSVREQKVLLAFQEGKFELLVCSFESVRIGTNLDQAGAIYFVDSSINDTEHKQACARISRQGTKHYRLTATFVYVRETLSEEIFKYHEDRRAGKTIEEAAARFEKDDVHDHPPPRDFYRMQCGRHFDGMKFSYERKPDSMLTDLFTSDMAIEDMFEMICDAERSTDDYQISLKFSPEKRPACYDLAKQIIVEAKAGSFRLEFNVPRRDVDLQVAETLTANITLTEAESGILESIGSWHKNMPSVPVTLRMLLRSDSIMDLVDTFNVIRASCSCCKWCGWRTVYDYDSPFAGCHPIMQDQETTAVVPNEKLFGVTTVSGCLHAQIKWDAAKRMLMGNGFAPVGDMLRSYMEKAREINKEFGVVPQNLRYDLLTARFFSERPNIYQRVLVKLEDANINDTIRFEYKGRQYEAFIREILPIGMDWFAVGFVVESEKPATPIIIQSHDFVDMKRVVKIGPDAFSIKDIIRMVQQQKDPAKTDQLKTIVRRADISDAEKLELASALV